MVRSLCSIHNFLIDQNEKVDLTRTATDTIDMFTNGAFKTGKIAINKRLTDRQKSSFREKRLLEYCACSSHSYSNVGKKLKTSTDIFSRTSTWNLQTTDTSTCSL